MEAIIFIGIQASGKSSFYIERFFTTHVRVSLDLLRTRHRERRFVETCLAVEQPFVVDNTNPTVADRQRYIPLATAAGFRVHGYFFQPDLGASLRRNEGRHGQARVPAKGIAGTLKRLEPPTWAEGFDRLFTVTLGDDDGFQVEEWLA